MKKLKIVILVVLLPLFANNLFCQKFDLSPFYGWQMNGKIKFYQGEVKTNDNPLFGATLDAMIGDGYGIRLMYARTDTRSHFRPYNNFGGDFPAQDFDIANEYYQIGSIKSLQTGNIEPYGVVTLGAARYHNKASWGEDLWRFSMTMGLGAKFFFNDKIGLKVEGAFMMPLVFTGVGYYFGIGSGGSSSGLTLNSAIPMLQGNFNAGLVLRFGD